MRSGVIKRDHCYSITSRRTAPNRWTDRSSYVCEVRRAQWCESPFKILQHFQVILRCCSYFYSNLEVINNQSQSFIVKLMVQFYSFPFYFYFHDSVVVTNEEERFPDYYFASGTESQTSKSIVRWMLMIVLWAFLTALNRIGVGILLTGIIWWLYVSLS